MFWNAVIHYRFLLPPTRSTGCPGLCFALLILHLSKRKSRGTRYSGSAARESGNKLPHSIGGWPLLSLSRSKRYWPIIARDISAQSQGQTKLPEARGSTASPYRGFSSHVSGAKRYRSPRTPLQQTSRQAVPPRSRLQIPSISNWSFWCPAMFAMLKNDKSVRQREARWLPHSASVNRVELLVSLPCFHGSRHQVATCAAAVPCWPPAKSGIQEFHNRFAVAEQSEIGYCRT